MKRIQDPSIGARVPADEQAAIYAALKSTGLSASRVVRWFLLAIAAADDETRRDTLAELGRNADANSATILNRDA